MDHLESEVGKFVSVNGVEDGTREEDGWDEGEELG